MIGYVGAAATKSIMLGLIILATAALFVPLRIEHPVWMLLFLVLTAVTFSLLGFIIGIWADGFEKLQFMPLLIITPLTFLGGSFYSIDMLPPFWQNGDAVQPGGLPGQRLPLELLRQRRRQRRRQPGDDAAVPGAVPGRRGLDLPHRLPAQDLMSLSMLFRCGAVLALAATIGGAAAHDTWFRALPSPRAGEALLLLGTGNRFPVHEFAVGAEHLRLSGCRSGSGTATLAPVTLTSSALLMRAQGGAAAGSAGAGVRTCWAQLAPFDVDIADDVAQIYLDEIAAPASVRQAWAAMQARGVRWRERFTKHARIEIGGAAASPTAPIAGLGMDVLLRSADGTQRLGDEFEFQVLRDGQPLAGFAVELLPERGEGAVWLTTDAQGRVRWKPPAAGAWVLRGTDLRLSGTAPDAWESRFVTLAFEVVAPPLPPRRERGSETRQLEVRAPARRARSPRRLRSRSSRRPARPAVEAACGAARTPAAGTRRRSPAGRPRRRG